MKIRNGFVSNSSSSSFVIGKSYLTAEQIEKIKNHIEVAEKNHLTKSFQQLYDEYKSNGRLDDYIRQLGKKEGEAKYQEFINILYSSDSWRITDEPDLIRGDTCMDNFDMQEFLELIGVDMKHVIWGG